MRIRWAVASAAAGVALTVGGPAVAAYATVNQTVDAVAFADNCDHTVDVMVINLKTTKLSEFEINGGPKFTVPTESARTLYRVPVVERSNGRRVVLVKVTSTDTVLQEVRDGVLSGTRTTDTIVHEWSGCYPRPGDSASSPASSPAADPSTVAAGPSTAPAVPVSTRLATSPAAAGSLPVTGPGTGVYAMVGFGLIAVGGAGYVVTRNRRQFEA